MPRLEIKLSIFSQEFLLNHSEPSRIEMIVQISMTQLFIITVKKCKKKIVLSIILAVWYQKAEWNSNNKNKIFKNLKFIVVLRNWSQHTNLHYL